MRHGQIFELKTTGPGGHLVWAYRIASRAVARDGSGAAGTPPLTTRAKRFSGR
jgi:hypothetical protein